jgi:hypothetical protein
VNFAVFVGLIGLCLLFLGLLSAAALFMKSVNSGSRKLQDIDTANLWLIFGVGILVGLPLSYFTF